MSSISKPAAGMILRGVLLGFLTVAGVCLGGDAHAQPRAPITYAGRGAPAAQAPAAVALTTASLETSLAGGGEGSYGYGAQRTAREGAVIDVRRNVADRRVEAALTQTPEPVLENADLPQAAPNGQGAAPWLEQERVGPPYEANGRWYVPTPEPGYAEIGEASWYGPQFHGQATASGEPFDQEALTAAHPTLPIPSLVQVTNLENGREVIVRINDRGPFVDERLIDVSRRTAEVLGFESAGRARVHVRYLGPAPRHVGTNGEDAPASRRLAAAPMAAPAMAEAEGPVSLLPAQSTAEVLAADQTTLPPSYQRPAPRAQPAPAIGGGYMVQVGAFSNIDNARAVQAEVAEIGPVAIDTRQTARGELFRVRLGPWESRAEAEAARRALADLGHGEAILAAN